MWKKLRTYIDELTNEQKKDKFQELTVQEREFLPGVLETMVRPPAPAARKLLWVLAAFLIAAILWICLGSVDEVAVAEGKIIPSGESKIMQAEDKGVIRAIHVTEGQFIHKGDLLIELDTTMTQADLDSLKQKAAYYQADIERLLAEQNDSVFVMIQDSSLDEQDKIFQKQLYASRMEQYHSKLAAAVFNLQQEKAALAAEKANCGKLQNLYKFALEKSTRVAHLADENAVSTFTVLEYQSKAAELEANLIEQRHKTERAEWAAAQAMQQLNGVKAEHSKEITEMLVESRRQLALYKEELKKAEEKNRLAHIVAPIDGKVAHLSVHTVGGVVTAAQALLEIVPEDAALEVEAWVQNKDIGFIQNNQEAAVKIETFSFQKYGTLEGHVLQISPDAVEDKEKGRRYRVIIQLDKPEFQLKDRTADISAGMTASAEIKIREKKIIEFFLDPFRQYTSEALRER